MPARKKRVRVSTFHSLTTRIHPSIEGKMVLAQTAGMPTQRLVDVGLRMILGYIESGAPFPAGFFAHWLGDEAPARDATEMKNSYAEFQRYLILRRKKGTA